jgi:hypothetical protein
MCEDVFVTKDTPFRFHHSIWASKAESAEKDKLFALAERYWSKAALACFSRRLKATYKGHAERCRKNSLKELGLHE